MKQSAAIAAVIACGWLLAACGSDPSPEPTTQNTETSSAEVLDESSPAVQLAALDATDGGLDRVSDYETGLEQLAKRCAQTPADVSGLIIDAIALLTERGEKQTHLWLLDEMVAEIPEDEVLDDQSCEVLAGIIVLAEVQ
jgi:hypothetical protein